MNSFCILLSDTYDDSRISELSNERPFASIPFGCRYRLIDFMLSSLVKAAVPNIGIITKDKYSSLVDHLGWGKDWDLNRKNGGLRILTPFARSKNINYYRSAYEALISVTDYIDHMLQNDCIVADTNFVGNLDIQDILKCHAQKEADFTLVYQSACPVQGDMELFCDQNGRITNVQYHPTDGTQERDILLNVVITNKNLLKVLAERGSTLGWSSFGKDFMAKNLNKYKFYAYKHTGYGKVIHSLSDYYAASMDLLNPSIRDALLNGDTRILTRVKDSVPTTYGSHAEISNSLIADGCEIDGLVENSLLFRDVKVKKGAVIRNSIVLQDSLIAENASLSYTICDKDVVVGHGKSLSGSANTPFVIEKGKVV